MNIIFQIILLNLLLIYSLKYNIKLLCLLIILFSMYMLYMYYNIHNVIEGNTTLDEYKMEFAGLLNKDIKTSFKEDILYDEILNNFTKLLNLLDKSEGKIPSTQMCTGELGSWSECSRECGRGNMSRKFNVRRKAGKDGIKCIYENGQLENKECLNRLCDFHELCEEDHDCLSNYCSKSEKICTYPHMCERDKLQNCNFEQCQELEDKYGDYTYDTQQHRCINKFIDLNVKKMTVKDEVSQLAKDIKEESVSANLKILATKLFADIKHICKVSLGSGSGSGSGGCDDHKEEGVCNSFRDGGIPCYYDHKTLKCRKISENPEYTNSWDDISKELVGLVYDYKYRNSADAFFNCARFDQTQQ